MKTTFTMEELLPDLINHYEIGKEVGFFEGAIMAYKDVQSAINLGHGLTLEELMDLITISITKYEQLMEKLND